MSKNRLFLTTYVCNAHRLNESYFIYRGVVWRESARSELHRTLPKQLAEDCEAGIG